MKKTKLQQQYSKAIASLRNLSLDVLERPIYLPFTSLAIAHAMEVMRKEQRERDGL